MAGKEVIIAVITGHLPVNLQMRYNMQATLSGRMVTFTVSVSWIDVVTLKAIS